MSYGLYVTESNALYAVLKQSKSIAALKRGTFASAVISLCADGAGKVYYVMASHPRSVVASNVDLSSSVELFESPKNVCKIVLYRSKLYCAADDTLISFDLLCKKTDVVSFPAHILNFEPAGHGFVVMLRGHEDAVFAYHFNEGVRQYKVASAVLLGSFKQNAILSGGAPSRRFLLDASLAAAELKSPLPPGASAVVAFGEELMGLSADHCSLTFTTNETLTLAKDKGLLISSVPPPPEEEAVCTLCFCEFDGDDGVTLDCGHQFHLDCVGQWAAKWDEFVAKGNHIVFTNAVCPGGCKALMRHPCIEQSEKIQSLYKQVKMLSAAELKFQEPTKIEDDLLYYVCFKCKKPFFGGEKVCFRMQGGEPAKAAEALLCTDCQEGAGCAQHPGAQSALRKCRYCCNVATQRSFGVVYMCDRCDKRWTGQTEPEVIACKGAAECPLGGDHPDHSFIIGCHICDLGKIDVTKVVPPAASET